MENGGKSSRERRATRIVQFTLCVDVYVCFVGCLHCAGRSRVGCEERIMASVEVSYSEWEQGQFAEVVGCEEREAHLHTVRPLTLSTTTANDDDDDGEVVVVMAMIMVMMMMTTGFAS